MTPEFLIGNITLFVLAIFLGFELITKVPATLHTPLMSGANAISGISISKDVYEQVKTKSNFQYNDLGFQKVKENYFHAYDIVLKPFQRRDLTRQKK